MRTANRAVARFLHHRLHGDGNAMGIERGHNALGARDPLQSKVGQRVPHGLAIAEMQAKQVQLIVVEMRTELDAGNDAHAKALTRLGGFIESVHGIVIGDGDGKQLCIGRGLHHGGRCERSIRSRGMHLQIHERRRRRRGLFDHDR
nr:hypothetical protein [Gemmatimonas phototrophica]